MKKAIMAKKIGMTQVFTENGALVPVTVLEAGPCVVIQKKTMENDGYESIQVGFKDAKAKKVNKPPKITFNTVSSNNGYVGINGKKSDVNITCNNEKNTNRLEIFLAQNNATGTFKHKSPIEVGKLPPNNSAIISAIMATPINPPDKVPAGRTKFFVAKAIINADKITAKKLMIFFFFRISIFTTLFFRLDYSITIVLIKEQFYYFFVKIKQLASKLLVIIF